MNNFQKMSDGVFINLTTVNVIRFFEAGYRCFDFTADKPGVQVYCSGGGVYRFYDEEAIAVTRAAGLFAPWQAFMDRVRK